MDGSKSSFFRLAALPAVGETLVDPRPAFVFAADGARLLFANAAAAAALDADTIDELLSREFTTLNPIREQASRLSRILPTESARLEMLRFGGGLGATTITVACRRLNLAGDERALFAIATGLPQPQSLRARAEALTSAFAGRDWDVAVLDKAGRPVAATEAGPNLLDADDLREIAEAAVAAPGRAAETTYRRHGEDVNASAVHFQADGRDLVLVAAHRAPAAAPIEAPAILAEVEAPAPTPDGVAATDAVPEAPAALPRFTFEIDRTGQFRGVTPELAAAVGDENGALDGTFWADVAASFGSAGDTITRALATGSGFSTTLPWPSRDGGARDIELTAIPNARTHGYRGFGIIGGLSAAAAAISLRLGEIPSAEPPAVAPAVEPVIAATSSADATPRAEAPTAPARDDLDDVAQRSIESGSGDAVPRPPRETADTETQPRVPPVAISDAPPATEAEDGQVPSAFAAPPPAAEPDEEPSAPPSNVFRLPGAQVVRVHTETLSGNERDAFRRIAEALGRHVTDEPKPDAGTTPQPEVASPETAAQPAPEPAKPSVDSIDVRLVDRLPIGIVVFRDGRTLYANRTLADLLGYESVDALLAAGGSGAIFPDAASIAENISAAEGNVLAARADGSTMQVRASLHAVPFAGATALMLAVAGVDRDQALAAGLTASEARADELEAILDTATDGVIVMDRRGRMESMNRAAEALFGVDASQYFERYFTDLLADESQKAALDYLDGLLANGVASVLNDGREVIGRTPSGGLIPLFMTMGRIGTSNKLCAVLRDITHWKNVEEELVAARRAAESANTQKSDFLAKISHEIRTPLNAIIGFSEVMASERFGPIGNDRYREYLRDIHVSGSHLMSLINDLLDLSKIEAGNVDLAFDAVPVNAAIQECVALMQPQANRERIIIRTSLATEVPSVVADPRSLRQILLNLLSNAVKFTRAGGQVIVSSSLEANGEVVVRIRDTGIGMSEKDVETALKPFRQVSVARADRDHGTGLGLPLTKALVEANRATFSIDSAPNQGTLVKITFPTTRVLAG
jgi:PAS domain S-box-containing protein